MTQVVCLQPICLGVWAVASVIVFVVSVAGHAVLANAGALLAHVAVLRVAVHAVVDSVIPLSSTAVNDSLTLVV